jgi:hypothetical protein
MVGKKYWYVMYYIMYQYLTLDTNIKFASTGAQMALASLVPFQGPKKFRISGPTPSNAPNNDVAPLNIITYRAIKTTGTLIVKIASLTGWILFSMSDKIKSQYFLYVL